MRNRKENCGKPYVGPFCRQHNYQIKKGMQMPAPCRGCGVGVICDYRVCIQRGGDVVKHRLARTQKSEDIV